MENLRDKHVLITGAGSGIGRASAMAFARAGAHLILSDINEATVRQTAADVEALGRKASAHVADVSDFEQVRKMHAEVIAQWQHIDILMNNAGVAVMGRVADMHIDEWRWQVGINLWGPIHFLNLFLPGMIAGNRGGHIVNICSLAGLLGAPTLGAYSATKFAMVGLSEALDAELHEHGIGVTAVCPGFVKTNIANNAKMVRFDRDQGRKILETGITPEQVATQIIDAVRSNTPIITPTFAAVVASRVKRYIPSLMRWTSRRAARRLGIRDH